MTTSLDTNVIVALWDEDDSLNSVAHAALQAAIENGQIVMCGAVYAELLALPGRTEKFLDEFINDAAIRVDWILSKPVWRCAGRAFEAYANRRRRQKAGQPRRILTDFLIGAHALENGYSFLTLDRRTYRAAFTDLRIVGI